MTTENMNKGVQILLERIKSNPEEFAPDITGRYPEKWRNILQQVQARANGEVPNYLDFLPDAEIQELWRAMQSVRGDQFTKQVMNTLLRDGVELSPSSYLEPSDRLKTVKSINQIIEGELNKTFEQVYANHPVYGTPR
jgi:hypothetical protein